MIHIIAKSLKGPLHTSSVDRAGSIAGTNFALGSYEKFQPGFRDETKDPGLSCIKPALKCSLKKVTYESVMGTLTCVAWNALSTLISYCFT